MATTVNLGTIGYWSSSTNYMYGELTYTATRNGTTITLSGMKLKITSRYSSNGSSSFWFKVNGTNTSFTINISGTSTNLGTYSLNNTSFTSAIGNTSARVSWESSDSKNGDFTVSFDSGQSTPNTPTISATCNSSDSSSVTWGTTSVGYPTATVYLYGDTNSNPTTQLTTKTTTGNTTYSHTGLSGNTKYYYKATAANSIGTKTSSVVNITTYPAGISSIQVDSVGQTSAALSVACASSGNELTTTLEMSDDNSTWTSTGKTDVQGTTQIINLTGLNENTTYTKYFRITTSVGSSASESITFTTGTYPPLNTPSGQVNSSTGTNLIIGYTIPTIQSAYSGVSVDLKVSDGTTTQTVSNVSTDDTGSVSFTETRGSSGTVSMWLNYTTHNSQQLQIPYQMTSVYGSVNGKAKAISKFYCSINGRSKKILKLYGSVNGKSKRIF